MNQPPSLLRRGARSTVPAAGKADEAMSMTVTPPMATRVRSSSVDSFDEEYFSKTYIPLSNLPTPPMSLHSDASTSRPPSQLLSSPTEYLDPELLGPAIHLTNLIPSSTSLTPASSQLIHALLTRAALPLETIALAVCILDALNSRFALQWRRSCPLETPLQEFAPNEYPQQQQPQQQQQHVDSVHPELIPLCALILAEKFLDDEQQSTKAYVSQWGRNMWTCEQVNYTQWCLLDNLGGRLLPLWDEGIIIGALEDMERAGRPVAPRNLEREWLCATQLEELDADISDGRAPAVAPAVSDGHAVLGLGQQFTPMDTPLMGSFKVMGDEESEGASGARDYFQVPERSHRIFNPAHVDPSWGMGC